MKCIYCLRTNREVNFIKREHIIPKSIGGIDKLNLGIVCDECNEYFSKYEKRFVYDTPISLEKINQKNKDRHGSFCSNLGTVNEGGNIKLGYIEQGFAPHIIPQFIVSDGDMVVFEGDVSFDYQKQYNDMLNNIRKENVKKIVHLNFEDLEVNKVYITWYKAKVFSCKHPETTVEKENYLLDLIIHGTLTLDENTLSIEEGRPTIKQNLNYNMNDYYRIICKIAFNTFAHYNTGIVYNDCFNLIRRYIRYSENTNKIKFCCESTKVYNTITAIKASYNIPQNVHCIYVTNRVSENDIFSMVSLYEIYAYVIRLGTESCQRKEVLYINEIDNRKEYNKFN